MRTSNRTRPEEGKEPHVNGRGQGPVNTYAHDPMVKPGVSKLGTFDVKLCDLSVVENCAGTIPKHLAAKATPRPYPKLPLHLNNLCWSI